jgi:hypothetical protein
MRYEWRCNECNNVVTIIRSVDDRNLGPVVEDLEQECKHGYDKYARILSLPVSDFETMRNKGILERLN